MKIPKKCLRTGIGAQPLSTDYSSETGQITVVIDDEESNRRSIVRLVAAGGYEVEAFPSAEEFLQSLAGQAEMSKPASDGVEASAASDEQSVLAARIPPARRRISLEVISCLICDLRLPGLDGLQLQQLLQSANPFLSMIFVTGYGEIRTGVSAMKAGAVDFLEKPVTRSVLLQAIQRAVKRTNELRAKAVELGKLKGRYNQLTPRERDVFALICAGLLNKQVAAHLHNTEKTVKQHRGVIMRKMEAESFADLVLMADRIGVRSRDVNLAEAKGILPH